jgi:hypothetical protein
VTHRISHDPEEEAAPTASPGGRIGRTGAMAEVFEKIGGLRNRDRRDTRLIVQKCRCDDDFAGYDTRAGCSRKKAEGA